MINISNHCEAVHYLGPGVRVVLYQECILTTAVGYELVIFFLALGLKSPRTRRRYSMSFSRQIIWDSGYKKRPFYFFSKPFNEVYTYYYSSRQF